MDSMTAFGTLEMLGDESISLLQKLDVEGEYKGLAGYTESFEVEAQGTQSPFCYQVNSFGFFHIGGIMKRLAIETITKPMKLRGISKGIAELDGQRLEIDLDNLMIDFGGESFELDRIAGTKEVIDISFFALIVVDGAGCFINGIYILVAVLV